MLSICIATVHRLNVVVIAVIIVLSMGFVIRQTECIGSLWLYNRAETKDILSIISQ